MKQEIKKPATFTRPDPGSGTQGSKHPAKNQPREMKYINSKKDK